MGKKILSPLLYEGTMDSALFEMWFKQCLLPELPEKSVIIMDNAAFHRKNKLYMVAQDAGHELIFLPPYSPELNPIEQVWSWIKRRLKKTLLYFQNFDNAILDCFQFI